VLDAVAHNNCSSNIYTRQQAVLDSVAHNNCIVNWHSSIHSNDTHYAQDQPERIEDRPLHGKGLDVEIGKVASQMCPIKAC